MKLQNCLLSFINVMNKTKADLFGLFILNSDFCAVHQLWWK